MAKIVRHVVPHPDGGWKVVKPGSKRASARTRTQLGKDLGKGRGQRRQRVAPHGGWLQAGIRSPEPSAVGISDVRRGKRWWRRNGERARRLYAKSKVPARQFP